ncbi:MAG: universal stress protein [Terriglobales bacterium]
MQSTAAVEEEVAMGALLTPSLTSVTIKNILFATDFSPCSETALPFAAAMARRFGATLFITHIISPNATPYVPMDSLPAEHDYVRNRAQMELEKLARSAVLNDIEREALLRQGELWETMAAVVQERQMDLIVAGTHGREGVPKLVLGSVAEEIFRLAACPVMTVGPHVTIDMLPDRKLERIVFATDFSDGSLHALPYAIALAAEDKAQLTLLNAIHLDSSTAELGVPMDDQRLVDLAEQRLLALLPPAGTLAMPADVVAKIGHPKDVIIEVAGERKAHIIIMGVHGAPMLASHNPWTVAHHVVCHAHCPVLTVRGH